MRLGIKTGERAVRPSRTIVAVRHALVLMALLFGFLTLPTGSSQATTTVFDNYTGIDCECGIEGPGLLAAGFTLPFGAVDSFAGAAAFVSQSPVSENAPQPFTMSLYSSTADGAPESAPLWTSGTLFTSGTPGGSGLIGETYVDGPSILLLGGTEYFLALNLSATVGWLDQGPHFMPTYSSDDGVSWTLTQTGQSQFQIYGDIATAPVPEPSTWAMMLVGFAGFCYVAGRRNGPARLAPST
jgi:PEP-CTERM motif